MCIIFIGIIITVVTTLFHEPTTEASHTNKDKVYFSQDEVMYGLFTEPVQAKGIYVPASKMDKLDELIELAKETEVNSFVIDVKDDYGYLTFDSDNAVLEEMGMIRKKPLISDMTEVMNRLYKADIYPIARIVAFKDNVVGKKFPERLVQDKIGQPYQTSDGQTWLNPYDKRNWEYLLEISKEAISVGFKEIQFDYIRFHESMKVETVNFSNDQSKTEIITEFTKYMYEHLKPYGVYVSADVFGAVITSSIDAEAVGQDYKELSKYLDYISPMIYPSHYGEGSFGVQYPDLNPYDIILRAMQASNEVIKEVPRSQRRAKVRPWLQDFTATWVDPHQVYGKQQVKEQIQGTYDAVIDQWMLWNAAANYTEDALEKE